MLSNPGSASGHQINDTNQGFIDYYFTGFDAAWIASTPTLYVMGGGIGNVGMYSSNGATWTTGTLPQTPTIDWQSCTVNSSGTFVAIGQTVPGVVYQAVGSGTSWTLSASTISGTGPFQITCDGTTFLVSEVSSGTANNTWTGTNGVTWVPRSTIANLFLQYAGGKFIAAGDNGSGSNLISTSSNGISWSSAVVTAEFGPIAHNGTIYLGVGHETTVASIWTSSDALTWTNRTLPLEFNTANSGPVGVVAIGTKFALTFNGYVCVTTNGTSWTYYPKKYIINSFNAGVGYTGGSLSNPLLIVNGDPGSSPPFNSSSTLTI